MIISSLAPFLPFLVLPCPPPPAPFHPPPAPSSLLAGCPSSAQPHFLSCCPAPHFAQHLLCSAQLHLHLNVVQAAGALLFFPYSMLDSLVFIWLGLGLHEPMLVPARISKDALHPLASDVLHMLENGAVLFIHGIMQVSTSRQAAGDEDDPAAVVGAAKGRLVSPAPVAAPSQWCKLAPTCRLTFMPILAQGSCCCYPHAA